MLIIQRPTVETVTEEEDNRQQFAVGPLDPGFGHTLGNSLRRTLLSSIPGAAITTTLTERGFRNADKTWKGNDLRDADAMSAAIPYCDVVLTDKYAAAQLARSPAVTRLGTLVLPRLRDLSERLLDLIALRQSAAS